MKRYEIKYLLKEDVSALLEVGHIDRPVGKFFLVAGNAVVGGVDCLKPFNFHELIS